MAGFDLDALRSEAGLEPHTFTVGGRTFDLPPILPVGVMEAGSTAESLQLLFSVDDEPVDDESVAFLLANLSMVRSDRPLSEFDPDAPESDLDAILERLYGITKPRPNRDGRRAADKTRKTPKKATAKR